VGERAVTTREFPAWDYRVQDKSDTRIADLEAAVLESNDIAAKLREELELTKQLLDTTVDVRNRQAERIHELREQARS
jgi:hypothetical protein